MISIAQLRATSRRTGLNLFQQEKDYCLKLFLYYYFRTYQDAVFKGGTCLRYLHGIERFSEDLDFNLSIGPEAFRSQVRKVIKELGLVGIKSEPIREELFEDAYTCEVGFEGPLFENSAKTRNKIRIDAGRRTGTLRDPVWRLIASEYPETKDRFLVLAMSEEEMMVEKLVALMERRKGRDLYDVWFMLRKGVSVDKDLFAEKSRLPSRTEQLVTKEEYERDMRRLMKRVVPYEQVSGEVKEALAALV